MNTKYFVISLPRTGTTSLSKMARICGLNPKHAPHFYWEPHIKNDVFDFFSDTPIFDPKVIEKIIGDNSYESKFIFIDRDFSDIFKSWVKMGLYNNYLGFYGNNENFDFVSYNNAFGHVKLTELNYSDIFSNHKKTVMRLLEENNKELLIYNFDMGWDPFCKFIGCDIPQDEIPKLNTNTFFDPY